MVEQSNMMFMFVGLHALADSMDDDNGVSLAQPDANSGLLENSLAPFNVEYLRETWKWWSSFPTALVNSRPGFVPLLSVCIDAC